MLALCSLAIVRAQAPPTKQRLTVETPSALTLKAGTSAEQSLTVTVQPGYHVNSDRPRGEFLIPFKLTWSGEAVKAGEVTYPQSQELQVGGERLVVFTGTFDVRTHFEAPAAAAKGPAVVTGKLSYQACNDQMCFRPASVEVRLPVVVE